MACSTEKSRKVLAGLPLLVAGLDVSQFGETELAALLAEARVAQRCLDGLVMRIGVRSNQLAALSGAASAEESLGGDGTVSSRQARRDAARAKAAESIDGLRDAVSNGETSGEHVDAIARHTAKLSEEQRAALDFESLIDQAKHLPSETFDRLVKRRVEQATDHGLGDTKAKQAASEFRHWFDRRTGMGRFAGSLDPERYETLTNAIDQHMVSICATAAGDGSDEPVAKTRNLAARALVELVTGGCGGGARSRLPAVTVIVDHDTVVNGPTAGSVRETENGHPVAPQTVARLCCDAVIRRVTVDDRGLPVNVGRKYRTATDAQWSAIKALHANCAWGGCDAPINWCQAHHIREWEHGGPTDLDNLVPLCSQHHHRVHEGQWNIKLLPDRTLEIYKPNGTHHATIPPPQRC